MTSNEEVKSICIKECKIGKWLNLIHLSSGGATHKGGGAQNFKKLMYGMYIIYIKKNAVYRN